MRTTYRIESVFFKTLQKDNYIDSAVCLHCNSTLIVYDIDIFTDDMLAALAKLSGKSSADINKKLLATAQKVKKYGKSKK